MQERYRLYQRENGMFYLEERSTKKQESLRTKDKAEALGLAAARNQAHAQPALNVAMARTYLIHRIRAVLLTISGEVNRRRRCALRRSEGRRRNFSNLASWLRPWGKLILSECPGGAFLDN